ncbi:MAG: mechanosensitive ion channel [Lacunisphaera sp.]|nr:mechanosensitive ion channel [Lacunisphaera sp.]
MIHSLWPLLCAETELPSVLDHPLLKLGKSSITLLNLIYLMVWIVGLVLVNGLLRQLVVKRLLARTHFDPGLQFAISRFFGFAFMTLGLYVALLVNGVDLSSLAVIAGALGIGLGFGLQNIVANFVSGLILLAERPVAIGDRIEVGGVAGKVHRINLRSTTVITNDNITMIVPNTELVSSTVTNWSYGDPKVRIRIPIGVAYGSDTGKVRRTLEAVAAAHPDVLKEPAPAVFFIDFGDSSLDFELAVWTEQRAHNPRRFRSEINFAIEKALRENAIDIPFPQRVVHLRPAPPTG